MASSRSGDVMLEIKKIYIKFHGYPTLWDVKYFLMLPDIGKQLLASSIGLYMMDLAPLHKYYLSWYGFGRYKFGIGMNEKT